MDWADRIGRRIRLRDLHILLAVAEHGSMAKASAQLAVSHPVTAYDGGRPQSTSLCCRHDLRCYLCLE